MLSVLPESFQFTCRYGFPVPIPYPHKERRREERGVLRRGKEGRQEGKWDGEKEGGRPHSTVEMDRGVSVSVHVEGAALYLFSEGDKDAKEDVV